MAKLHEVLAVESSLETQANTVRADLINTFEKKQHHFSKKIIAFQPFEEGKPEVTEQQLDLQTTVHKEITWIKPHLVKALDASYQVAEANTIARADIVLEDGTILLKDIPATALLELEKRITELMNLVKAIPTLDPAKGFTFDPTQGIYQAREVTKTRTKKDKKIYVLYEATDKHPAQTQLHDVDVPVGTIREQEWSGLITPVEKSEIINRVEVLQRAVRRARSRANETVVPTDKKIGDVLLDFIFPRVK